MLPLSEPRCVTLASLNRGVADSYTLLSKLGAFDFHAKSVIFDHIADLHSELSEHRVRCAACRVMDVVSVHQPHIGH
jgi:hypothetical protein